MVLLGAMGRMVTGFSALQVSHGHSTVAATLVILSSCLVVPAAPTALRTKVKSPEDLVGIDTLAYRHVPSKKCAAPVAR